MPTYSMWSTYGGPAHYYEINIEYDVISKLYTK